MGAVGASIVVASMAPASTDEASMDEASVYTGSSAATGTVTTLDTATGTESPLVTMSAPLPAACDDAQWMARSNGSDLLEKSIRTRN